MKTKLNDRQIIKYLLIAAGLVLLIVYSASITGTAVRFLAITKPLIIGFCIAYVLNILIVRIEGVYFPKTKNKLLAKTRRAVSLLIAVVVIVLVLFIIINIVLPQIINTLATIAAGFPALMDRLDKWVNDNKQYLPLIAEQIGQVNIDWASIARSVTSYATNGISSIFSSSISIISIFTAGLFDLFVAFAFAIYLLVGKERLLGQLKRVQKAFVSEKMSARISYVFAAANEAFSSYIAGQCAEAVILGTLCTVGMWIFGFPYAAAIGVFVGATALIPMIGAYLGAGVGTFLILMVNPMQALWFLVYILVLQQLENNLIYPRVVGTSIGLPGVWVLVSVVIGGGLGGIVGMILGVPITATVYKLMQAATRERLNISKANAGVSEKTE